MTVHTVKLTFSAPFVYLYIALAIFCLQLKGCNNNAENYEFEHLQTSPFNFNIISN